MSTPSRADCLKLYNNAPLFNHMSLNLVAVALFVVSFIIRWNVAHDEVSIVGFVLSLVAIVGVGISGWLGGKLAYHFGVRVADEVTQAEGFR